MNPQKGYTLEQLQQMFPQQQSASPMPVVENRGYTLEELQSNFGGGTSEPQLPMTQYEQRDMQTSLNQQDYLDRFNETARDFQNPNFGDSKLANAAEYVVGKGVVGPLIGLGKNVVRAGDFALTAANEIANVSDNPSLRFGTDTRKSRIAAMKGQTGAEKVGGFGGEIIKAGLTGGIATAAEGAVASALPSLGKTAVGKFAQQAIPTAVGNVAQGATMSALAGDEYSGTNLLLDSLLPVALRKGLDFSKGSGILGKTIKENFITDKARKLADMAEADPEKYAALENDFKKMGDFMENASDLKSVGRRADNYDNALQSISKTSPEVAQEYGSRGLLAIKSLLNNADPKVVTSGSYDVKDFVDALDTDTDRLYNVMRATGKEMDPYVQPAKIEQLNGILDSINRNWEAGKNPVAAGEAKKILNQWLGNSKNGLGSTASGLADFLGRKTSDLSADRQAALMAKQTVAEYLLNNAPDQNMAKFLREIQDTARLHIAAADWLKSMDGTRLQGVFGSKWVSRTIGGLAASLATNNPLAWAAGSLAGEKVGALANKAFTVAKVAQPIRRRAAKELGILEPAAKKVEGKMQTVVKGSKRVFGKAKARKIAIDRKRAAAEEASRKSRKALPAKGGSSYRTITPYTQMDPQAKRMLFESTNLPKPPLVGKPVKLPGRTVTLKSKPNKK